MENYTEYALSLEANKEVQYWIEHNLVNYLKTNPEIQDDIEHIIDYLVSDESPKNLVPMSYEDAHKNAEKWTKKLINKGEHIKEADSDTQIVLDFKDGFKIVKLVGKNAYEREGYLMRHCVASYYGMSKEIYSLRDENNMPHCTMEQDQQVKGKGNGNIHPKYVGYVVKFLEHIGMTVGDSEMAHLGYINVSKFAKYLSKDTKYFNKKYVPDSEKLIGRDGKEFASLNLLDVKPLIKETINTELKINFDLKYFLPLSFNFLLNLKKAKDIQIQSSKVDSAQLASSGHYAKLASSGDSAQLASSGDYAKLASSGDYAKLASSGDSAQLASSGDSAQLASSGDSAQLASSGDYAQLASSGHSAQLASSGHYAQLASSGHSAKLASSGDYAQLASSGDSAQLASSGDYAKLASSGHSAQLASSGDSAQLASSGDYAQLASSGHSAKLASSGDYAQLASSGDSAQLASSGDYAQLASSGDYAKLASSGDSAQLASSGHSAKLALDGKDGVGANIGYWGKIKGKIGNWITLAEYDKDSKPVCVKSVQIDGKKIKEDTWYILKGKKFVEDKK